MGDDAGEFVAKSFGITVSSIDVRCDLQSLFGCSFFGGEGGSSYRHESLFDYDIHVL